MVTGDTNHGWLRSLPASTLVLVEDDAGDALLVQDMLERVMPSVEVLAFTTIQSTVEHCPPTAGCILLDLALPDTVGLSGLRALLARYPDVPIIVLTGRVDTASGPESLAYGAQDYLVKGELSPESLERSIRYAIERAAAQVAQRELVASELRARENSRLERGLLPSPLLAHRELRVQSTYRPGRERALLGGDLFDVVELPDGRVQVLIGDVSGHGPDEAALGVAVRIAWRSLVLAGLEPEDVLRGSERVLLAERADNERFATCAMVSIDADLECAEMRLCGHPAPILITPDGKVRLLDDAKNAPPLSLLPHDQLPCHPETLGREWAMVLYTDGLIEGASTRGSSERLGLDGLLDLVKRRMARTASPLGLGPDLIAAAEGLQGGPLTDDVAVLVLGSGDWMEVR